MNETITLVNGHKGNLVQLPKIFDNVEFLERSERLMLDLLKMTMNYIEISPDGEGSNIGGDDEKLRKSEIYLQEREKYNTARDKVLNIAAGSNTIPFSTLVNELKLDALSQEILLVLFMAEYSPSIQSMLDEFLGTNVHNKRGRWDLTCGSLLKLFFPLGLRDQMKGRSKFALSSPLVKHNIMILEDPDEQTGSLLNVKIKLAPRMVAYLSEDTHQYATSTFIDSEFPEETINQVVLPQETKDRILNILQNSQTYREEIKKSGIEDTIKYGKAITILEYGESGTGKTMFARALANELRMPLISLRPDIAAGNSMHHYSGLKEMLRRLFLESELRHGIVFLDECDVYLADADDAQTFLTEIEKFDGIVILATNKPNDLNPSMDRRLLLKIRFDTPDKSQRKLIWENLLPRSVSIPESDIEMLAEDFPFNGGYIKNAVLSAIHLAASDTGDAEKSKLSVEHLREGAYLQEITLGISLPQERLIPRGESDESTQTDLRDGSIVPLLAEWFQRSERYPDIFPHSKIRGTKLLLLETSLQPVAQLLCDSINKPLRVIILDDLINLENGNSSRDQSRNILKFLNSMIGHNEVLLIHDIGDRIKLGLQVSSGEVELLDLLAGLSRYSGTASVLTGACPEWHKIEKFFHRIESLKTVGQSANLSSWKKYFSAVGMKLNMEYESIITRSNLGLVESQTAMHRYVSQVDRGMPKRDQIEIFKNCVNNVQTKSKQEILFS